MRILAIETSCDETALSLLEISEVTKVKHSKSESEASGRSRDLALVKILAHEVASQISVHAPWGGVVPMLAKREHTINLPLLFDRIFNLKPSTYDLTPNLIAVTYGPGLEPALWTGINFAKELGTKWGVPLVATDHMHGHIASATLKLMNNEQPARLHSGGFEICKLKFPTVALLISGGHTQLVLMRDLENFEIVGNTRDDAVGEAFDKVARILGLPYPGGPEISKLASAFPAVSPPGSQRQAFVLPRPMINSNDLDFSFSGLKTAVLYLVKKLKEANQDGELTEEQKIAIAYEFEQAVTEVLIKKTLDALTMYNAKSLLVGGGVIANKTIREALISASHGTKGSPSGTKGLPFVLHLPDLKFTGDNATMIGVAAYYRAQDSANLLSPGTEPFANLRANGNLALYR